MARGKEHVISFWTPGQPADSCAGSPFDLTVRGKYRSAWAYDPLNGVEQKLKLQADGKQTRIKGLLMKDYPVLVRMR